MAEATAGATDSFPLADRPRLRPIEVIPRQERGRRVFVLRDPSDTSIDSLTVSEGAAQVLALLADGRRTVAELSSALVLRGVVITESQLRTFLTQLDEGGYLEGPRAAFRFEQRRSKFLAEPARPAVHTGAYSADPDELRRMLRAGYLDPDGPGDTPQEPGRGQEPPPLRAAIAPHVDLHRGAPTYSWAYKALAEAQPAELYVVLGTCHTPVDGHFAATRKAYATPLGPVPADIDFLDRLERGWGRDLYQGEFSHAGEHSIEFQAVYLRALGLAGEGIAPIVPILCDSLHSIVAPGQSPGETDIVSSFLTALQQALATDGRRMTLIAAVDLAHIGPQFGDSWSVDLQHQARVRTADLEMLDLVIAPDADAYYAQVMRDRDARRICGLTPIYLLTRLMQAEQRPGELLRYTQWVAPDQSSSVTFVSAIFR
jgi:AmmeMemoRadiSam system protein B